MVSSLTSATAISVPPKARTFSGVAYLSSVFAGTLLCLVLTIAEASFGSAWGLPSWDNSDDLTDWIGDFLVGVFLLLSASTLVAALIFLPATKLAFKIANRWQLFKVRHFLVMSGGATIATVVTIMLVHSFLNFGRYSKEIFEWDFWSERFDVLTLLTMCGCFAGLTYRWVNHLELNRRSVI